MSKGERPPQSSRKIGLREAGRLRAFVSRVVWLNPSGPSDHLPFQGRQSILSATW